MANHEVYTPLSWGGRIACCRERLLAFLRKPLFAYILIAFAISFSFHLLERRADQRIVMSTRASCERGNDLRRENNLRIMVVREAVMDTDNTKDHELSRRLGQLHNLRLVDCNKVVPKR